MSYSEAQIGMMSLGHLSVQGYITSLENDKSNEARALKTFYEHSRDVILEMMPWPFATKRVNLQLKGTAWDGWGYAYAYPNDCVYASHIVNPAIRTPSAKQKIPFRIVRDPESTGKLIMTDQPEAILEYNMKITDPAEFDAMFAHAVSLLLATMAGKILRVDANILTLVNQEYQAWQLEAGNKSLREEQTDENPASEFVSVRV